MMSVRAIGSMVCRHSLPLLVTLTCVLTATPLSARTIRVAQPVLAAPDSAPPACGASFVRLAFWVSLRPELSRLEQDLPTDSGTNGRYEPIEESLVRQIESEERSEPGARAAAVPPEREHAEAREGTVSARYRIRRDPLETLARHDTLFLSTRVSCWMESHGPGSERSACGSEKEPFHGRIGCMTLIGWDDDWRLEARSVALPTTFDTRCKPEPPGMDLTKVVNRRVERGLAQTLMSRSSERIMGNARIHSAVASAWRALNEPLNLGGGRWLEFAPDRAVVAPLLASGDSVRIQIAFETRPRYTAGASAEAPGPPPPPRVRLLGDGLQIPIDCEVPLDTLARRVVQRCGEGPPVGIRVLDARVRGGGGRVTLTLELAGSLEGAVHLQGTPTYDPASLALVVAGLEYTAETRAALGASSSRTDRDALDSLRVRAADAFRIEIGRAVAASIGPLGRSLNQELIPGISIAGGVNERRLVGTYVTDRVLGVRLVAAGRVGLKLD